MLKKYYDYAECSLLESLNESIVYFSPNLSNAIYKIDSDISRDLIKIKGENIKDDITLIDIDDRTGYVTFTTSKNAIKNLKNTYSVEEYPNVFRIFDEEYKPGITDYLYSSKQDSWTKSRSPIRIGRLVNKLLPKYSQKEVEDFTNKFKSYQNKDNLRFEIVEGDDIAKWYSYKNYALDLHSLNNSCMKSKPDYYFQIYTKNPEVCKMLIMYDDFAGEGIVGRALLWKLESNSENFEFEYFMDRQYAASDSYIGSMREYAIKKGWAIKERNSHDAEYSVIYGDWDGVLDMVVKLKDGVYSNFPYVDTFKCYDPNENRLYNKDEEEVSDGLYILTSTEGKYKVSGREMVYSEWYEEEIEYDDAVWSDLHTDYFPSDRAVYIDRVSTYRYRDWYPTNSDDIVYDGWNDDYMHINDSIYSEEYDYYLYEEDAVGCVNYIKSNGDCNTDSIYIHYVDSGKYIKYTDLDGLYWFYILDKMWSNWGSHYGVFKSELTTDWQDDWIPKKLKIDTYKVDDFYITELDAELLGYKVDKEDHRISDIISYISDLIQFNLYDKLIKELTDLSTPLAEDRIKQFNLFHSVIFENPTDSI